MTLKHSKQPLMMNLTLNTKITEEKKNPMELSTNQSNNTNICRNWNIQTRKTKASINNPKQNLYHKKAKKAPGWEWNPEHAGIHSLHQLLDAKAQRKACKPSLQKYTNKRKQRLSRKLEDAEHNANKKNPSRDSYIMIGQVENRRKEVRCKYRELSFATTQFSLSSHPQVSQHQIPAPSDRHRLKTHRNLSLK